jgi:hypothetical protein
MASAVPSAVDDFDWEGDVRCQHKEEDLIVYEMHVRGFTKDPSSGVTAPGTYAGVRDAPSLLNANPNPLRCRPSFGLFECVVCCQTLRPAWVGKRAAWASRIVRLSGTALTCARSRGGSPWQMSERLQHIASMGITAVELMPIHEFNELEYYSLNPVTGEHRFNFWGYSTVRRVFPHARRTLRERTSTSRAKAAKCTEEKHVCVCAGGIQCAHGEVRGRGGC